MNEPARCLRNKLAARAMRSAETQAPPPLRTKTTSDQQWVRWGVDVGVNPVDPWALAAFWGHRKLELVTMVV